MSATTNLHGVVAAKVDAYGGFSSVRFLDREQCHVTLFMDRSDRDERMDAVADLEQIIALGESIAAQGRAALTEAHEATVRELLDGLTP